MIGRRIITCLLKLYWKVKSDAIIRIATDLNLKTRLEGNNRIENSNISSSYIGRGTYIEKDCILSNTQIGKFCSIGDRVRVISATHPTTRSVSTHPCFFSMRKQAGFTFVKEQKFEEHLSINKNLVAIIGNDVWIGNDVTIIGGHNIGDGAIIATGAVVTRDVMPYEIVGGVPAKTIRYRFPDETIQELLKIEWWNKDFDWLSLHSDEFSDVDLFIMKNRL